MPFTIDGTVLTKYIPEENEGEDVVIVVPDGIETIGANAFKKWFDGWKKSEELPRFFYFLLACRYFWGLTPNLEINAL